MENFKKSCVKSYENGYPKITDQEFDRFFGDNEDARTKGKVKLPFWMGSLDKIRDQCKLDNWLEKDTRKNIFLSAKIDGVSGLYHQGKMYTRGNGEYGEDVSKVLKYLNLPEVNYTVRGEIVIKKKVFDEKYSSFKNARNMVAGLLNRKDECGELNDISFYAFEIVGKKQRPSEQYIKLQKDGFTVPIHLSLSGPQNFDILYNYIFDQELETETDGVVVAVDLPYTQPTKGNPKFAMALKKDPYSETAVTVVKDVEWNISKWRVYKPVVVIDPVELKGVTIARTSGFNAKYIFDNKINVGSIIRIKRSGGVIPTIVDVLSQSAKPSIPPIKEHIWSGVDLVAPADTQEEGIKKLMNVVKCLGIKHLSIATVEKLYEAGFNTLLKVVFAGKEGFISAGIGNKMSEKITTFIRFLFFEKGVDVVSLLGASCCLGYGIGVKMIQLLFEYIPEFMVKGSVSKNEIAVIPMFGEKRAIIVEENYRKSLEYLHMFSKEGVKLLFPRVKAVSETHTHDSHASENETQDDTCNGLLGCRYVFTGFRDPILEEKLDVFSAVSGKTDYLVVKSIDLKTTKTAKAKKLGIKIITLDELKDKLQNITYHPRNESDL